MTDPVPSKERFTPEYTAEVVKQLESQGWRPDSRGDPECCDEASAAGAQIIEQQRAEIERLQSIIRGKTFVTETAPSTDLCTQLRALTGGNRLLGYAAAEEIESLRACLSSVSGCGSCEACRGAALRALGERHG